MKKKNFKKWIWVILLIVILLILDQGAKIYANLSLQENSISIIDGVLKLSYWKNTEAAIGLIKDNLFMILILHILILAFIIRFLVLQFERMSLGTKVGLGFILAGGFSNLIDRLLFGGVINYIDVTALIENFPIFNLADVYIVIGLLIFVIAFAVYNVKQSIETKKQKEAKKGQE